MQAIEILDDNHNLDILHLRNFLSSAEEKKLFYEVKQIPWYRVCYISERHDNSCETPCYTNFFGGFDDIKPYQPVPTIFDDVIFRVSNVTQTKYNAILVRLYFDGSDNITWHTDGRTFLGDTPNIASLSLGATCSFQLRKMTHVWPCAGTPNGGVDLSVPQKDLILHGGDLLVMRGKTQQSWHHRVPKQSGRGPRININFRYILPDRDDTSIRGVRTFYKYMVCGDSKSESWDMTAPSFTYEQLTKKYAPIRHLFKKDLAACTPTTYCEVKVNSKEVTAKETELGKRKADRASVVDAAEVWSCEKCTYTNYQHSLVCDICDLSRVEQDNESVNASKKKCPQGKLSSSILKYFKPSKAS